MAKSAKSKNSAPVIGTESQDKALELTMSGETREERRGRRRAFTLENNNFVSLALALRLHDALGNREPEP